MHSLFLDCYLLISILIAIVDIILGVKSFKKNKSTGKYLGFTCFIAAVVDISYLISILNDNYLCMSIMSSIYFISIDFMLICFLIFTIYFTKGSFSNFGKLAIRAMSLYALFEVIIFSINPFHEFVISYIRRDTIIAKYSYQMGALYWMHLIFTYFMVIVIVVLIIRKIISIPDEYKSQYRIVVSGIIGIVLVNATFLYIPGDHVYNFIDYSICGYSLIGFLLYWCCFNYSTHGMLNRLKTSIFESIDQGIVLFDYDNTLILYNEKADNLLGGIDDTKCHYLNDFLDAYDLTNDFNTNSDNFSVQCYVKHKEIKRPLRCDIKKLKNDNGQMVGQLFVFSNAALEVDLLTGFQNWESFQLYAANNSEIFSYDGFVAVCDINSLSIINSTIGNIAGDQQIRNLALAMRESFPKHAYYVRGVEANLIALCSKVDEQMVQEYIDKTKKRFEGKMQYAINKYDGKNGNIVNAINEAIIAMKAKKLLDKESIHSEMITSLIKALQECDSDTERHVKRTQALSNKLAKRLGLSDVNQSRLSLLSLLHDIGKITIPLEILNKPGKLTDEEWVIIKNHVIKGYEIASSNNELKIIADEIRHHHERWDGKGYPDGLSGEQIPLLSRIISVVDAFDAMINNRSYKSAMSFNDAIEELRRCSGTQFDPNITNEFVNMLLEEHSFDQNINNSSNISNDSVVKYEDISVSMVHSVPYCRYTLDENDRIIATDSSFEKMMGYNILNTRLYQIDLIPKEDRQEYTFKVMSTIDKDNIVFLEHRIQKGDGNIINVYCMGRKYYDSAVRKERIEVIVVDINDTHSVKMIAEEINKQARIKLSNYERLSKKDSLTGLLNHASFREDVELKMKSKYGKVLMIMADVDHFKEYNDSFGHHNGDKFLILAAQALQSTLRKDDRACRMGGDEFALAIFFDENISDDIIKERAGQIFNKVAITLSTTDNKSSLSMGAVIAHKGQSFNSMYEESDAALYEAKNSGRNRIVIK